MKGSITVTRSRKLTESDLFTRGIALCGTCDDFPKATIELILPSTSSISKNLIPLGSKFTIQNDNFSCLVHLRKPTEETICFTLVPITYDKVSISKTESIKLNPPQTLNIEGTWPIIDTEELKSKDAPVKS